MEKRIETIVIPSGGSAKEDLERLGEGLTHGKSLQNTEVHYLISGIGPDLEKAIYEEHGKKENHKVLSEKEKYDVHRTLWNTALEKVDGIFGIDCLSRTSEENLLYSFPSGSFEIEDIDKKTGNAIKKEIKIKENAKGNYTIVTRPLHVKRFELIEKRLRKKGYLKGVEIDYLYTDHDSSKIFHDVLALCKELIKR